MKYTIQYILCLCFLILACVIPFHEGMKDNIIEKSRELYNHTILSSDHHMNHCSPILYERSELFNKDCTISTVQM